MAISKIIKKNNIHFGEYRVRVQPMINGRRITIPVRYAKTKRQAELLQLKLVEEAKHGWDYEGAEMLLQDAFASWIDTQVKLDRWSPITERSWRFTLKMVKQYCPRVKIKDCTPDVIREFIHTYVKSRQVTVAAHSTADRLLTQLRTYFLTLEGVMITKSPVPKKALHYFFRRDRQTIVKDKYVLTDEELDRIKLIICNDIDRLPINNIVSRLALWIEAETGMRPQEIQALKFSNLVKNEGFHVFKVSDAYSELQGKMNGHLKSRKCGEWRLTPPISNDLYHTLVVFKKEQINFLREKKLENPHDLIFLCLSDYRLARLSKPITQRSMNNLFKELCKKAHVDSDGLPLTCYTLRTTVATRLARLGDYSYASNRLGNSLSVYIRYYVKPLNRGYGSLMSEYLKM